MSLSPVRLEQLPSLPVAVIRRSATPAELSRVVPECCGLVWKTVRAQQVRAGRNVAIYLDGTIRLEAGVELLGSFTEQDDVVRSNTPGGLVASVTHWGPYGGLGAAHSAIRSWCQANQRDLSGPSWEIYGHWQSAWDSDPSQIRTDVCHQVLRKEH